MHNHIEIIRSILATMQRISQDTANSLSELADMIEKELTELERELKCDIMTDPTDASVIADHTGTDASQEYRIKRLTEKEADFNRAGDRCTGWER
ncbi:MAG: hypothetical protein PHS34_08650 [Candidatus Omnitrophica bacterium]|nr:hypothetical protein [Candidatus Omnitrophota bacterium]